ncbi:MAG: zinc ribbon domain-containing protein [Candidatus Coatesbacteria bacterium]|nr:MAG: zinc ribbon domain-containing protein [Candidatus Coatesbacteria bacterium]
MAGYGTTELSCKSCGAPLRRESGATATTCPYCGTAHVTKLPADELSITVYEPDAVKGGKPAALKTIAIMMLIAGIYNLLNAVGWLVVGLCFVIVGVIFTITPALYCGIVGTSEIIYGAKLLAERPDIRTPPYGISVLGVTSLLFSSIVPAILETINLVLMSDTEVKEYLSSN